MRIFPFFFVNVLVSALYGLLSFAQGHDALTIFLRIVVVLVSLQLVYVLWLFAISLLPSKKTDEKTSDRAAKPSDDAGMDTAKDARNALAERGR